MNNISFKSTKFVDLFSFIFTFCYLLIDKYKNMHYVRKYRVPRFSKVKPFILEGLSHS